MRPPRTGLCPLPAMRDLLTWSLNLGRWGGVYVRLHSLFLLAAIYSLHAAATYEGRSLAWFGLAGVGILLGSTLLHELGHGLAARRFGGSQHAIVLWPFGGLAPAQVVEPRAELAVALCGPILNLLVCCAAAPILISAGSDLVMLFDPLRPPLGFATKAPGLAWQACLELVFWINWMLAIVNLLPAAPFDGARVVRAVMTRLVGARLASLTAARGAQLTAVALLLGAALLHGYEREGFSYSHATMPLTMLAILLFFCGRHEAERLSEQVADDLAWGYDFSQGYTSLECGLDPPTPRSGPLRQWLESRREARRRQEQRMVEEDERRVDAVLARLHESGMAGLSTDERDLLRRVSERYRARHQG